MPAYACNIVSLHDCVCVQMEELEGTHSSTVLTLWMLVAAGPAAESFRREGPSCGAGHLVKQSSMYIHPGLMHLCRPCS